MKMALWCAWTNGGISADPGALSVRGPVGHPDWFNADCSPTWKPRAFSGAKLCLGCPEAKDWAIAKTQSMVSDFRLDYLKHDCGPLITTCNKTTHRHHYGVDASYWATMGYYEVQEKLRKTHPGIVLENCSGGGHIKDFGAFARTHYTVTTDTLSNLPDRQSFWDSTYAVPPLILQAYTYDKLYKAAGDEPGPFFWRSAMMGGVAARTGRVRQVDRRGEGLGAERERDLQEMDPADSQGCEGASYSPPARWSALGWIVLLEPESRPRHGLHLPAEGA